VGAAGLAVCGGGLRLSCRQCSTVLERMLCCGTDGSSAFALAWGYVVRWMGEGLLSS
jgi:hypothetical protein